MYRIVVLGGFERYDSLREELSILLARHVFGEFLFLMELKKNVLIWYRAYVLRTKIIDS